MDHEQYDMRENRETANADMEQMIPRLVGDIASSRVKKIKYMLPQASRAFI